jgi:hypothetical protein
VEGWLEECDFVHLDVSEARKREREKIKTDGCEK